MSEVDDSQRQTGREAARGVGFKKWCGWRGSNPRPLASEANTLSTELQPQRCQYRKANHFGTDSVRSFVVGLSGKPLLTSRPT